MSLTVTIDGCANNPAGESSFKSESSTSVSGATPVGETLAAIVELSDMYRAPESYDVRITVLEILRGEASMDLLRSASASNTPAQNGFEYVLALIRFEYAARGAPGDKTWELTGEQFNVFSSDGKLYQNPSIVAPEPILKGVLHSGDSQQGWVVFTVAKDDKKPVMTFNPGSIWFQLY